MQIYRRRKAVRIKPEESEPEPGRSLLRGGQKALNYVLESDRESEDVNDVDTKVEW